MTKTQAINSLGGTVSAVAKWCGISSSAVSQWPEDLPPRIVDRVQAALWRKAQQEKAQTERSAVTAGA